MAGNGLFLLGMAKRRKELNYLGLEINKKVLFVFYRLSHSLLSHSRPSLFTRSFCNFLTACATMPRFHSKIRYKKRVSPIATVTHLIYLIVFLNHINEMQSSISVSQLKYTTFPKCLLNNIDDLFVLPFSTSGSSSRQTQHQRSVPQFLAILESWSLCQYRLSLRSSRYNHRLLHPNFISNHKSR